MSTKELISEIQKHYKLSKQEYLLVAFTIKDIKANRIDVNCLSDYDLRVKEIRAIKGYLKLIKETQAENIGRGKNGNKN